MRRGELAGLLWHNVDLDAARLTINQQIVSVQYQLIESDLKTSTSRRSRLLPSRSLNLRALTAGLAALALALSPVLLKSHE